MAMNKKTKRWIHGIIMFAFAFGFRFIPPVEPITEIGMQMIGAFVGMLWGWIFFDLAIGSIVGFIAIGLSDFAEPEEYLMSAFGNSTTITLMMILIFAAALKQSGLDRRIVAAMLNMKVIKGRPYLIFTIWLFMFFLISILVGTGTVAGFITLPILLVLFEQARFQKDSKQVYAFFNGIAMAGGLAAVSLPIVSIGFLFMGILQNAGVPISPLKYTLFALPVSFVLLIGYIFYCKYIMRVDLQSVVGVELDLGGERLEKRQKVLLALFVGALLSIMLANMPAEGGINIFAMLGSSGSLVLFVGLGILLRIDGETVINLRKIASYYEWNMVFFGAAIITIPSSLTSEATGLREFLAQVLSPIAAHTSGFMVLLFVLIATVILTNFINNAVAGVLVITVITALSTAIPNMDIISCICIAVFACTFATATPMASALNALICGQKDWVTIRGILNYGSRVILLMSILLITFGLAWSKVIF